MAVLSKVGAKLAALVLPRCTEMMSSRGMGAINPSKMPKKKVIHRTDDPNTVDMYAAGGEVESKFEPVKPNYGVKAMGGAGEMGAGAGGRFTVQKNLGKDLDLEAYLEGQAFKPKGMSPKGAITGGGVKLTKRFAKGGKTESKVNQAGVYTKPGMRKSLFESIKSRAVQGTGAGQWSARKSQLLAKQYKARGGGYRD
jgi:hypothetical protein